MKGIGMSLALAVALSAGGQPQAAFRPEITAQQFGDPALRFIRYARPASQRAAATSAILLFPESDAMSAAEMAHQLQTRAPAVAGCALKVVQRALSGALDEEAFRAEVRALRPAALLVLNVHPDVAAAISEVSRAEKVLTLSTRRDDIAVLSLAVVAETTAGGKRTQVRAYRNETALREENVRFPADVLALTRPVTTDALENYRQGIRAFDFDEWDEVRARMEVAVRSQPDDPEKLVVIYGLRLQAYVPSLYLGAALALQNGDCRGATPYLAKFVRRTVNLTSEEKKLVRQCSSKCGLGL